MVLSTNIMRIANLMLKRMCILVLSVATVQCATENEEQQLEECIELHVGEAPAGRWRYHLGQFDLNWSAWLGYVKISSIICR